MFRRCRRSQGRTTTYTFTSMGAYLTLWVQISIQMIEMYPYNVHGLDLFGPVQERLEGH